MYTGMQSGVGGGAHAVFDWCAMHACDLSRELEVQVGRWFQLIREP
jgi:hypothetical protein